MPYLTSLLMPVSAVVTGLPPTLSDVGAQLNTSNTILYTTSAATLSTGQAIATFLPSLCANVTQIPGKIDSTNSKLEDLKTTASSINSYTSVAAAEVNAIRTNLNGTITAEIQQIRNNSVFGTNSNIPLFVNQGTLTHLADSVNIDRGIKKASSFALVNTFSVSLSTAYNIFGVSTASVDQYLQIYDIPGTTPAGAPVATFLIPANSNFSFDFNRGFPFTNTKILVVNSLTPVDYNPGNSDVFITVLYN